MGQIRKSETEIEGPQDGRRKVGMGGDFPLLYRLALNNRHYGEGTQTLKQARTHRHTHTHQDRQHHRFQMFTSLFSFQLCCECLSSVIRKCFFAEVVWGNHAISAL